MPVASGSFDPIEHIEQKIARGEIAREAVEGARNYWRRYLADGVVMPNGERATITGADLHHLLDDDRILRKPFRMERALAGVYEIRTAKYGRRMGLSRWEEDGAAMDGYVIFEEMGRVWTMHLIDDRKLGKLRRQGERLWPLDQ